MSGTAGWDRARALWILALIGGISFFAAVLMRWDGPAIWAWKTSGVALLALWAAVNARSGGGWMIAAALAFGALGDWLRSEEHTSELQSLMRISYAVFCLKKKTMRQQYHNTTRVPSTVVSSTARSKSIVKQAT